MSMDWNHPENWPRPTEAQAHRALQIARERGWLTERVWIWEVLGEPIGERDLGANPTLGEKKA